jgi:hypothetical protein
MPKSNNAYIGSYALGCRAMADRIEQFPNDTHVVFFNGEEYEITPEMVPDFVRFLRSEANPAGGIN